MRSSSFVSSAALIVVTCLIGAWRFQPTNQPTNTLNFVARFRNGESSSDRGADFANRLGRCAVGKRAMPQGACVREDTARTAWATGCGDYDVYELGFDDDQGYNDVGEQMEIAGCVGGHNECDDGCSYEDLGIWEAQAPSFEFDSQNNAVYWETWAIEHSTRTCSTDCYSDINIAISNGDTGEVQYTCVY